MPECKFGMNDKLLMQREPRKPGQTTSDKGITIDDLKFHVLILSRLAMREATKVR